MNKHYIDISKSFIVLFLLIISVTIGWYSRVGYYDIKNGKFLSIWYISTLKSLRSGNINKGINNLELLLDGKIEKVSVLLKRCQSYYFSISVDMAKYYMY